MKNVSIIGGMMHMQSQQTLNKQKLIVVINITFSCFTSTAIFLCLFYINHTLYSNVISMVPFLLLFQLSILCCALASKTKRNFFQIIAALIIFTEVALFHLYSPPYSVSKAISEYNHMLRKELSAYSRVQINSPKHSVPHILNLSVEGKKVLNFKKHWQREMSAYQLSRPAP